MTDVDECHTKKSEYHTKKSENHTKKSEYHTKRKFRCFDLKKKNSPFFLEKKGWMPHQNN